MPNIKLKPCPFCGGKAMLLNGLDVSLVKCISCGAEAGRVEISAKYCSDEKVAEVWNRRVKLEGGESNG